MILTGGPPISTTWIITSQSSIHSPVRPMSIPVILSTVGVNPWPRPALIAAPPVLETILLWSIGPWANAGRSWTKSRKY